MLPKWQRLKGKKTFSNIYKKGKVYSNELFVLYFLRRNTSEEDAKAGFIVSKKISKKAVTRNKIKRRIREAYKLFCKDLEDIDLIWFARKPIINAKLPDMKNAIINLLHKAKLVTNY